MRIFLEPSSYHWQNHGDAMMLAVALARVRSIWRDASITVHTLEAEPLLRVDREAIPLDPAGSRAWNFDALLGVPRPHASLVRPIARAALLLKRRNMRLVDRYLDAVRAADLVLVTGGGSLNDAFRSHALVVLSTIELACDAGATTALVGQGLGPMSDRRLRARAAKVLPRVNFIALREGVAGVPLLESIGVDRSRVAVTGDDAIARAYAARPAHLGSALGVNVRVAPYSEVEHELVDRIGAIVRESSSALVPIPIAADDIPSIRRLLRDPMAACDRADPLARVAQCRVVVTGSYHAAVFALSMGVPAVAIAKSAYYVDKFRGLAGQFGSACRVLLASDPDFDVRLRDSIADSWRTAESTRESLLDAARQQIAASERAYERVAALTEAARKP